MVKEKYLYSSSEMGQKLRTVNLFEKFDVDGNGSLDSGELTELYNKNNIMITQDEICKLFGETNLKFTLQMFEKMNEDKDKLRNYRN